MTLTVELGQDTSALLRALGLLDGDDHVVATWFKDPLKALRSVLSNPQQRAALLDLLDTALPPVQDGTGPAGSRWHPLLDSDAGNVYLTVTGDVIGLAGQLTGLPVGGPRISGGLRLPLVDTAGELRAIAGTAEGPIVLALDIEWTEPDADPSAVRAAVTVDVQRGADARVRLEGVDVGAGPEALEVDTATLGRDAVAVLRTLVSDALAGAAGSSARIKRVADHLFGVLGLAPGVPALDVEKLLADPGSVRAWLAGIAADADALTAWGTHLAGLLGADLAVTGDATAASPLRAPLLALGPVALELVLAPTADGTALELGLGVDATLGPASVQADVTVFAIPLAASGATRVMPRVGLGVRAPAAGDLVGLAPTFRVGSVVGGIQLQDGVLKPSLVLTKVILESVEHGTVDLTDADAVIGVVTDSLAQALADALGEDPRALALLALVGLRDPAGDPGTPHRLDVAALARSPTRALGDVHRAVLADPAHPWSNMLGELETLLGLEAGVTGGGTPEDPWRTPLAAAGALELDVAAWNARDAATPAGEQRLRIGLLARADAGPLAGRWRAELLAIDLPDGAPGTVALLGSQELLLALEPIGEVASAAGFALAAAALRARARWHPGAPLTWELEALDVELTDGDDAVGPVTLVLPSAGLGLGDDALALLRLLARHALLAWGGDAAYVLGALLGLHRKLPGLPADWPLLEPPAGGDLGDLFADPAAALRDLLRRLATGLSDTGAPFAERALRALGALLRSWEDGRAAARTRLTGSGTYADPWAVLLAEDAVDLLAWLEPDGPPTAWAATPAAGAAAVGHGVALAGLLSDLAGFVPGLADALHGRERSVLGADLQRLAAWFAGGDGVVSLSSQLPDGPTWTHGSPLSAPHAALPRDPGAIGQIAAQLAAWAGGGARPVLLVGPPFGDESAWSDLLAVVEPGRPAAAHFDLRSVPDPAEFDLGTITAVASHYTANLHEAGADLDALVDQLGRRRRPRRRADPPDQGRARRALDRRRRGTRPGRPAPRGDQRRDHARNAARRLPADAADRRWRRRRAARRRARRRGAPGVVRAGDAGHARRVARRRRRPAARAAARRATGRRPGRDPRQRPGARDRLGAGRRSDCDAGGSRRRVAGGAQRADPSGLRAARAAAVPGRRGRRRARRVGAL